MSRPETHPVHCSGCKARYQARVGATGNPHWVQRHHCGGQAALRRPQHVKFMCCQCGDRWEVEAGSTYCPRCSEVSGISLKYLLQRLLDAGVLVSDEFRAAMCRVGANNEE